MGSWPELDAREEKMTPELALFTALTYMAGKDKTFNEAQQALLNDFCAARELNSLKYNDLVRRARIYASSRPLPTFLEEADAVLSADQKLALLTSLAQTSLANGEATVNRRAMFDEFLHAFDIDGEQVRQARRSSSRANHVASFAAA